MELEKKRKRNEYSGKTASSSSKGDNSTKRVQKEKKQPQLEGFIVDSTGKQVPTGILFNKKKLSLVGSKKIKNVANHTSIKENSQDAVNQQQPTLSTGTNKITSVITTSFKKNDCSISNAVTVKQFVDKIAGYLMGARSNTQNRANETSESQLITPNQSFTIQRQPTPPITSGQSSRVKFNI